MNKFKIFMKGLVIIEQLINVKIELKSGYYSEIIFPLSQKDFNEKLKNLNIKKITDFIVTIDKSK